MSVRTSMALDAETRSILASMTISGTVAKLPPGQLARPVYDKVNKALAALGGKWNRSKGGHVFESDPTEMLRGGVESGAVERLQQKYQFFETPTHLADEMAARLNLRAGERVLEPSAGRGRLCTPCLRAGAHVSAIEIWDANMPHLVGIVGGARATHGDFLALKPVGRLFDAVAMNPPFANRQGIAHIRHAFDHWLKPAGRIAAICDAGAFANQSAADRAFQEWLARCEAEVIELPRGTFSESGTEVSAKLIVVTKGAAQ